MDRWRCAWTPAYDSAQSFQVPHLHRNRTQSGPGSRTILYGGGPHVLIAGENFTFMITAPRANSRNSRRVCTYGQARRSDAGRRQVAAAGGPAGHCNSAELQWEQEQHFARAIAALPKNSRERALVTGQAYDTICTILAAQRTDDRTVGDGARQTLHAARARTAEPPNQSRHRPATTL